MANKHKQPNREKSSSAGNTPALAASNPRNRILKRRSSARPAERPASKASTVAVVQQKEIPHLEYVEFTRGDVARRARQLWIASRRPVEQQCQFWLEAELEIISAALAVLRELRVNLSPKRVVSPTKRRARRAPKLKIVR